MKTLIWPAMHTILKVVQPKTNISWVSYVATLRTFIKQLTSTLVSLEVNQHKTSQLKFTLILVQTTSDQNVTGNLGRVWM